MSADRDNFSHGDVTNIGRIHMARWWMVWRHVVWLYLWWQRRLSRFTLTTGETLWIVAAQRQSVSKP